MKRDILSATITNVRPGGLDLKLDDGREAWMPKREYSYNTNLNNELVKQVKVGEKIEVAILDQQIGEGLLASHKRVKHDPWLEVDESWIGKEQRIIVHSVTKHSGFGVTDNGIECMFLFEELDEYIKSKDKEKQWEKFRIIMPGDAVIGIVEKIDHNEELLHISISGYLKRIELNPEAIIKDTGNWHSPSTNHYGKSAVSLVSGVNKVIVIDNDKDFLDVAVESLKQYKYDVTGISSYSECIELLHSIYEKPEHQKEYFQVAIIDVNLYGHQGDLKGIELAKMFRQVQPYCKIILLTGEQDNDKDEKIRQAGDLMIEDYIYKPITPRELHTVISESLFAEARPIAHFLGKEDNSVKQKREQEEKEFIDNILKQLQQFHPGSTVALFSMDHVTLRVFKDKVMGGLPMNMELLQMLKYSPVRDCAIDRKTIITDNALTLENYPRHRWLLNIFEKKQKIYHKFDPNMDTYRSCIGVPVPTEFDNYSRCLFWLHENAGKFDKQIDLPRIEAYALKLATRLEYDKLLERIDQNSSFVIYGKSYSSLGHELFTIIGTLQGRINIIYENCKKGTVNKEELLKSLNKIRDDIGRIGKISQTFRQLAKRKEHQKVDVYQCLDEAFRMAKELKYQKSELRIGLEPETKIFVQADEIALRQVFFNLILNAMQFIEIFIRSKGIVFAKVMDVEQDGKKYAKILVSDTGPGIHAVDYEKVFDILFTTKPDGTGMGLDLCKTTIEGAGGKIRVLSSTLFVGTTFEVLLPICS